MKKLHIIAGSALFAFAALTSCQNEELAGYKAEADLNNAYTKAWLETIGLIPAEQDWCMLQTVTASVDGLDKGTVTKIYTSDPREGGRLKATVSGNGSVLLDVSKGTTALYAVMYDTQDSVAARGFCEIDNGAATLTPASLSPKHMSRHFDDFMVPAAFDAIVVCEDMGTIGDFDFNDIVLGLKTVKDESKTTLTFTPLAAGGLFEANVWIGGEDKGEIHSMMSAASVSPTGDFYNTTTFNGAGAEIVVDNLSSDWTIAGKWTDDIKLKIKATDAAYEIKAPAASEAPRMMCLPGDFCWPREKKSIKLAYTGFESWATGGYQGDDINYSWLDTKAEALTVPWEVKVQGERLNYFIATCADGITEFTYNGTTYAPGEKVYIDDITTLFQMFAGYITNDFRNKIVSFDLNSSHFNTSNVETMKNMFCNCEALISLDLSNFDTSNVTYMNSMFAYCLALPSIDLSSFDTSKVTNMSAMFGNCEALTSLDLNSFDTSNVTDMSAMFGVCKSLASLDLSNFDTSNVTNMSFMFNTCEALTSLDLSNFDTSKVTDMHRMFLFSPALTSIDLSGFNTSNVTTMEMMFNGCNALRSLDLSDFDTSYVTDMGGMFGGCKALTSLDLSNFNTSSVTNMSNMFSECENLTSLDLTQFKISRVSSMLNMFRNCNPDLEITCSIYFRNWCINNKNTVALPEALHDPDSSHWHIVG